MHILFPSLSARQWSMVTGWDAHAQSTAESPQGNPLCSPSAPTHSFSVTIAHAHISHHIHFDWLNYVCVSAACTSTFLYLSTCVYVCVCVTVWERMCLPVCLRDWCRHAWHFLQQNSFGSVYFSPPPSLPPIGHCKQTLKASRGKGSMCKCMHVCVGR